MFRNLAMVRSAAFLMLLATLAGCSGEENKGPIEPVSQADPGPMSMTIAAPSSSDGIVWIAITGAGLDSVTSRHRVMGQGGNTTSRQLILTGDLATGELARVWVADRRAPPTATITQAAARTTYEQRMILDSRILITK